MFQNCSVMILSEEDEIYKLEAETTVQQELCTLFSKSTQTLLTDQLPVDFDGTYKPNEDECLRIRNFQISDKFRDAVRDPLGITSFSKSRGKYPEMKALFVGTKIDTDGNEVFTIAFQKLRKEQLLTKNKINLFLDQNTFQQDKRFGFGVLETVDCCFVNGDLLFPSYFFARQIFDLKDYYRSATDGEVKRFTELKILKIADTEKFLTHANSWVRRKIASISDSKVLEHYSVSDIQSIAQQTEVPLSFENGQIVIPDDKEQIKIILGFLDEEAYKGPFSNATFLAGSKRKI